MSEKEAPANQNRIKQLRLERHKTQKEVGKAIGLSDRAIAHYEKGIREPKLETWIKLADFFDVSVSYLQGINNYKNNHELWKELYKYKTNKGIPINDNTLKFINEIENNSEEEAIKKFKKLTDVFESIDHSLIYKEGEKDNVSYFEEVLQNVKNSDGIAKALDNIIFIFSIYINSLIGHKEAQRDRKTLQEALRKILDYDKYATSKCYEFKKDGTQDSVYNVRARFNKKN